MKCPPAKALWEVKDVLLWKLQSLGVAETLISGASADEIWYWPILVEKQTEGLRMNSSWAESLIFPHKVRRIWRNCLDTRAHFHYFILTELTQCSMETQNEGLCTAASGILGKTQKCWTVFLSIFYSCHQCGNCKKNHTHVDHALGRHTVLCASICFSKCSSLWRQRLRETDETLQRRGLWHL